MLLWIFKYQLSSREGTVSLQILTRGRPILIPGIAIHDSLGHFCGVDELVPTWESRFTNLDLEESTRLSLIVLELFVVVELRFGLVTLLLRVALLPLLLPRLR